MWNFIFVKGPMSHFAAAAIVAAAVAVVGYFDNESQNGTNVEVDRAAQVDTVKCH